MMIVRYTHDIEVPSSLTSYQRENGHLLSTEDVPIPITLNLKTIEGIVSRYSTVAVSYYMFDCRKDSAIIITLYDSLGYIIGRTESHITTTSETDLYQMYTYSNTKELKLGDILQHIPAHAAKAVFHLEVISFDKGVDRQSQNISGQEDFMCDDFNRKMRTMECTEPAVKFQLSPKCQAASAPYFKPQAVEIWHNAADNDNNDSIEETQNRDNSNVVLCTRYKIQSLMNKSEYFMKHISKTPHAEDGQVTVSVNDIDPKMFQTFLEFVHFGKYVYVDSEYAMPLHQCCREMLEIAGRFLCPELARDCAECIVQITSKDTVFADIRFLATHYNGPYKLEIISRMAKKQKELKPENHVEQLHTLCQQLPDVAACLLYRLTISEN